MGVLRRICIEREFPRASKPFTALMMYPVNLLSVPKPDALITESDIMFLGGRGGQ